MKNQLIHCLKSEKLKICIFLGVLCFLVYGNSIRNGYALDDELVIYQNAQIHQGIKAIPEIFTTRYSHAENEDYGYRPIVKVSFAMEYSLFGENPHISHFINILIYAFTCIFLFLFLQKLFKNYSILLPLLVTTLFLVHPIHAEVVDSLKNRDALFSFFSSILSAYFFIKYAETNRVKNIFLGGITFIVAMASKIDAMTFIVIIPLFLYFFGKCNWKQLVICFGCLLLSVIVFILIQKKLLFGIPKHRVLGYIENPLYFIRGYATRGIAALATFFWYIQLFVFPKKLICYYGYNQVDILYPNKMILIMSLIIVVSFLILAFIGLKKKKVFAFGILYFFISISMFLNILVPAVGIVAERFAYIPSLGLCILLAIGLLEIFKISYTSHQVRLLKLNRPFLFTISIVLVLFSVRTIARNFDWKNHYTLYSHDIVVAEKSVHLQQLYATKCLEYYYADDNTTGQTKEQLKNAAIASYKTILGIYPDDRTSLNDLGKAEMIFEKNDSAALPLLQKAVEVDTNYVVAFFNLATCEHLLGNDSLSEKYFLKSIALNPHFMPAYVSLTNLYLHHEFYDAAFALNYGALDKGIKSAAIYSNLGTIYLWKNDSLKTADYYEIAVRTDSINNVDCRFLENYFLKKGNIEKYKKYQKLSAQKIIHHEEDIRF
ncbi:MAG: hypothetical protein ABI199_03805 [Bacteroidia bacterium]